MLSELRLFTTHCHASIAKPTGSPGDAKMTTFCRET